jgi:tetratricopeptide (TPR) repeat protein
VLRFCEDFAVNAAFGRYRLLERLGEGGMAEVFKAKSYGVEGFEKVLVIKRILPKLARRPDFVDMFVHEAKLAVCLSHANIVQVFDLGKTPTSDAPGAPPSDAYYMAMEYVHGLDLASVLAQCRRQEIPLPIQIGVYVASEVAKGLDHAHRRRDEQRQPLGIVHCDVSPQNVLLSFEGDVKVTDFGIAKARGALRSPEDSAAHKLQGKFGYMSPEQARGERVDARSDLFSLGIILYECVTGVNPFHAPTTLETLRRVQACEYPPIELFRADCPAELVAVIKTAMAPDPAQRYPDAGRMYEALLAFLYAQCSRYGAHDLAECLSRFRETGETSLGGMPGAMLAAEARTPETGRTPVEVPRLPQASSIRAANGVPLVAIDRAAEMGERREVTALVIDLPRQTPPVVLDLAGTIVERWGGRLLRREGAHVAAIFGLGDPDGRDTEMATRCALVALRRLDAPRPAGAGIHTGRIHVSNAGEASEDSRLGLLLDTARELAAMREGQAAMSAQAMRQVQELFEFEPTIDGGRAPNVSAVVVKDVRGPGEGFGRIVGRNDELRRIGELLTFATTRTARLLTIRGDHGVGKTRLLYEVERRLRKGNYNVGFHIAACPPRGKEFPLSGIACMLHVLCGVTEGDTSDRILAVQPRLRALGLQGDEVNAVLSWLGASVPSPSGNAKTLLRQAFTRMVQSLCEDRPHTFCWDVAHAMDEDSLFLLEDVFQRLRQTRVVFAFAVRAGFAHPLEKFEGNVVIDLGDLPPPDVEKLVALRIGVDEVPDELMRFVRSRAGGHPLFVQEVIKALVDAGAIAVGERRVVSMKLVGQDLALPKTLRGLVASRVSRLSNEDRATLQAAAVLGDPIDLTVLSNMLGQGTLERSIAVLERRDFVVHTGPSELRFASPIIPEIVADALTPEAAREMHAAAGQALETTLGDRAWEHASRIAAHLYDAGDRERAAAYFAKSGERRLETRQFEAAARDYERAVALTDPGVRAPEELTMWLERLASAVRLVRSSPDAAELCNRVIERVDAAGVRELRVRARVATGHALVAVQQLDQARQRLAEAESIAEDEEALLKLVLLAGAEMATRQGDYTRALRMFDALHRIVRVLDDNQEKHRVALHLAHSHAAVGNRTTALANLAEAEELLPEDRAAAFERTRARALVDYYTRDFRSAVLHWERAIDMARDTGLTYQVMASLHNLGDVLIQLDDLPRAYGALQQSLALSDEYGFERLGNLNRMFLAYLDGIRGTVDGGRLLRQGIAYAEGKDFTNDVISGRVLLAKLLHRLGQLDAAREEYTKTREIAVSAGHGIVADECSAALENFGFGSRG